MTSCAYKKCENYVFCEGHYCSEFCRTSDEALENRRIRELNADRKRDREQIMIEDFLR